MIFDITSHAKGFARQHGSTVIGLYGTASSAIAVFEGSKDPIDYMDLTAGLAGTGTGLIRVSIGYSVPYAGEILLCYSAPCCRTNPFVWPSSASRDVLI